MLPALCSLFTALSCVSGVTGVTQKPPVLTLTQGQTATMDCNLGTVTKSGARWYKQVLGGVPHTSLQSLLYLLLTLLISSLSTRVPSHTDTMLPALCSLFTALSCVSGVIVVTQKPPVLTLTQGQTATMDCNLGTVTDQGARWYKQVPGGVPQHVIRHYHEWSSPKYGSGFSSPKFTSTHSSKSDYKLIISNVEVGDSAVYYCKTWDSSAKEYVFGQGTKLIVNDVALPAPVLTVLPPSSKQLESKKATLVCLASEVAGGFADVRWLVNGNSVTSGVITGSALQQTNKKFTLSSYLTIDSSEWENAKTITCEVSAGGKAASVKINQSECSE
ncbi:immunoglobulin lambda-1 light chain-like [Clarias gariepinus]|uniref:immunoglobulin lambda-1 light chain-like n=1 Tax=Clarias gariepinus TaxID=13013 RepID=UPI00234C486D|nr:immunoglobulin lambda-1 light chain-like [Clarias gariepinus]